MKCKIPPPGWYCTREAGHENPCAALPLPPKPDLVTRLLMFGLRFFAATWAVHFLGPQLGKLEVLGAVVCLVALVSVE